MDLPNSRLTFDVLRVQLDGMEPRAHRLPALGAAGSASRAGGGCSPVLRRGVCPSVGGKEITEIESIP